MKDETFDPSMVVVDSLHGSCGGLSVEELCDQLATSLERAQVAEWHACQLLAELADRFDQGAPELGAYGDVYQLARLRFDMGVRRARERVRIGRALRALPEVSRAFVDGRISYARVREITRVATPADEREWLDLAETLPLRTLERRVAEAAEPAGKPRKTLEPANVRWTSSSTVEVRFELAAATWALLERALEEARARTEAALSDAEAIEAVAREALSREAGEVDRADVRRMVVLYSCVGCARAEIETGAGAVELDAAVAARFACGAGCVDLEREGRGVSRGGEIPAAVRRAVLLRDRMRCRAPGCTRRRYVDVHHVIAREHGGEHSRSNCVTLCTSCHDRVHHGRLLVEGDADGDLRFGDPHAMTPGGHGEMESTNSVKVLEVMRRRRVAWHPDAIVEASDLPIAAVFAALFELEVQGRVVMGFDGRAAAVGGSS